MAQSRTMFFAIDKAGYLTVSIPDARPIRVNDMAHLKTILERYANAKGEVSYMVSSSIDFPEDSTDDKAVIDLCHYLRPGGWTAALEAAVNEGMV